MNLKLNRPLAFIDLETTGVNVGTDRIVEISVLKIHPDREKEVRTYLLNPGVPIPEQASLIHGIKNEDVKNCPLFNEIAQELEQFLAHCDLAGYNSNRFDIPLLAEEFLRAGIAFDVKTRRMIDVQGIFHRKEERTLSAAYKFYCSKVLDNAHSAEADVTATWEILEAQLARYPELQNDVKFLHDFSSQSNKADLAGRIVFNEHGEEIFNFGKHKGKTVEHVLRTEPSYYHWMMEGDFPMYTKKVLTEIRNRLTEGSN